MVSYIEDCNKPLGSTKYREVLDQLIDYGLFKDLVHLMKIHIIHENHIIKQHTQNIMHQLSKLLIKCGSGL
jgi:hypothetical protein